MNLYLGNIEFDQVEDMLGYKLTKADKEVWEEYQNDNADLTGKETSFHCFDIPRCIVFKGEKAKEAVIKMFVPEKMTKEMGQFMVYEQN